MALTPYESNLVDECSVVTSIVRILQVTGKRYGLNSAVLNSRSPGVSTITLRLNGKSNVDKAISVVRVVLRERILTIARLQQDGILVTFKSPQSLDTEMRKSKAYYPGVMPDDSQYEGIGP